MDTPDGRGTVIEVDLLRQRVKVRLEEEPETVVVHANADIAVLRSGKAKKNDPPIPVDLAPISGAGKRAKKENVAEEAVVLDAIKFRYSEEVVAEEAEEPTAAPEEAGEEKRRRNSRRRSRGQRREERGQQEKAETPKQEKSKQEKPKRAESGEEEKPQNRPHHRRNHRRRPRQGGEGKQGE